MEDDVFKDLDVALSEMKVNHLYALYLQKYVSNNFVKSPGNNFGLTT